jgi:DNA-binding response OmpR family regulator
MKAPHILVVDDEEVICHLLERGLKEHGFTVQIANTATNALTILATQAMDLVILDHNLPDLTGRDVCRRIRRNPNTRSVPVIIVTGASSETLPVDCLDAGADDYVSKPFNVREIVARAQAILRRPVSYSDENDVLQKGPLTIHVSQHSVVVEGKPLPRLTPKEFALLHQIVMHAPSILNKNMLALKVWGQTEDVLHHRTLDVHIRRIRSKLGARYAKYLVTIPAVGYQWANTQKSNR